MALQFTDEDFQAAWKELDEPQLDGGWELFTETMGVKIYRLYDQETGLYEYKVFGILESCPADLCADVYMDLTYRKHWDSYVKELYENDFEEQRAIYWEVKYPFPLSNRDYVYIRERRDLEVDGRRIFVVLARSTPQTSCPEKSGVIRVNDYKQSLAIESDGASGTKMFMNYFDNPGGSIPTWLINWAAKIFLSYFHQQSPKEIVIRMFPNVFRFCDSGVPGFLKDMKKACNSYKSHCQKK